MRSVAFVAVAISTAAVIASAITTPMLYSYVQTLQSQVNAETDFCRVSLSLFLECSWDIWTVVCNRVVIYRCALVTCSSACTRWLPKDVPREDGSSDSGFLMVEPEVVLSTEHQPQR